jgi:hypothetical protein
LEEAFEVVSQVLFVGFQRDAVDSWYLASFQSTKRMPQ